MCIGETATLCSPKHVVHGFAHLRHADDRHPRDQTDEKRLLYKVLRGFFTDEANSETSHDKHEITHSFKRGPYRPFVAVYLALRYLGPTVRP